VKIAVFWDVTRCGSVRRFLVTTNVVPSSPILIILMKEALRFYETLLLARATVCNIPEDDILHWIYCLRLTLSHGPFT
jgi:hypothetical protein